MPRRGCLSGLSLLIVAIILVALAVITFLQGGPLLASPGPLSQIAPRGTPLGGYPNHAAFENQCSLCHAPFWSNERMADRCMRCHVDVRAEIEGKTGLHGRLDDPRRCKACHPDHQGRDAPLTREDVKTFPHEVALVGFSLEKHQKGFDGRALTCATCHTRGYTQFDTSTCLDCHQQGQPDFTARHVQDVGAECLRCHDGTGHLGRFDHDRMTDFPLEGEHREVKCRACHPDQTYSQADPACYSCHAQDDEHDGQYGTTCESCHTPRSWEDITFTHDQPTLLFSGRPIEVQRACYTCHQRDDEHKGAYGTDCATCHTTRSWEDVTFDHNATRLPLTGKHRNLECQACHVADTFAGLDPACVSCHAKDDVHNGQLGTQCEGCHVADGWDRVTFDHARTRFPLDGAHVEVPCTQCHTDGRFAGTPTDCVACHQAPADHVGVFGDDCASCHTTAKWTPATLPDHTFPLDHGGQGVVACSVCHDQGTYTSYTCYNCHEHTPTNIREKHVEEGIYDYQNCVRCHPTGREKEGKWEEEDD